jgi:hypothetical protein
MGFPKIKYIRGRRYVRAGEILEWEKIHPFAKVERRQGRSSRDGEAA